MRSGRRRSAPLNDEPVAVCAGNGWSRCVDWSSLRSRLLSSWGFAPAPLVAQAAPAPGVERNVVYGIYPGLALLLDVHRPSTPNGAGIVAITGIGFHAGAELPAPRQ